MQDLIGHIINKVGAKDILDLYQKTFCFCPRCPAKTYCKEARI